MSHYTDNVFTPQSTNNSWAHLFGYVPEGARVLDIGCSSGNFGATLIKDKNCQVIGLDLDKDDVNLAKKRLTEAHVFNIETDDLTQLGKFDIIIMADVIEHLVDPISSLERIMKQLKKDGKFLFSIPNMAHISIRLMLLKGFYEYTDKWLLDRTHIHYYDEVEVKHVLGEAGFKIEAMQPTTVAYPPAVLTKYLKAMGLTPDDRFFKQMAETKSDVFEFVGWATASSKKLPVSRTVTYTFPPDELSQEIVSRDRTIQDQTSQIEHLTEEAKKAHQKLGEILNSRTWRMTKPLRQAAGVSKKARNGK